MHDKSCCNDHSNTGPLQSLGDDQQQQVGRREPQGKEHRHSVTKSWNEMGMKMMAENQEGEKR